MKKLENENCRAVVTPEVLPPLGEIEEPDYTKPSERIKFHIGMAQHHGRQALAHLISAGWELSMQKQAIGYGGWAAWCENELNFSQKTADRYCMFYQKVLGEQRAADGIPLAKRITNKELEAATVGMEGKSARAAMIDLGIIRRPDGWGGKREDAGRKRKDVAEELKSDVEGELCANEGRDLIEELSGWALGADDGFGTLGDGELANAVKTLSNILARAREILAARNADRKSRS